MTDRTHYCLLTTQHLQSLEKKNTVTCKVCKVKVEYHRVASALHEHLQRPFGKIVSSHASSQPVCVCM